MRFAVVEYTSKSGIMWKHMAARPNYLADPDKEIDPTSFGCYVSAFEGEHIPLKGLITGEALPVHTLASFSRRLTRKIIGRWPGTYDLSYLQQFDVLLIVHQISDGQEMTALVERLKRLPRRPYLIGVPTQPFGILKEYWGTHPAWFADFKQFMAACDVFLTIVESTLPAWQQLTLTPVVYAPQPYPVEFASRFFAEASAKQPVLLVAGVTDRQDIAKGQLVAKQVQQLLPQYAIHVTDTPGHKQNVDNLSGAQYSLEPFRPWQQQLAYLAKVRLVINTDYTQTRGRLQADCAAVGTPSIGADSDAQRDLYLDFYADSSTSVATLVEQAKALLTDNQLYARTAAIAAQALKKYNYQTAKENSLSIIAAHPKKV